MQIFALSYDSLSPKKQFIGKEIPRDFLVNSKILW